MSILRGPPTTSRRVLVLPTANRILAATSPAGRSALLKLLTPAVLTVGDVLYQAHATIRHIYFPLDCLVSLLAPLKGHAALEVSVVGREGMVGVPLAMGVRTSLVQAIVQGSGNALCMSARAFQGELARQPALQRQIGRYVHDLIAQLTQTAACNVFHPVEARCARSLLIARDRMQSDELELTHQFLAQMLGVRRVGVTVAAGNLQRSGAISYSRGHIVILDAARLAEAACECYDVTRKACGETGRADD